MQLHSWLLKALLCLTLFITISPTQAADNNTAQVQSQYPVAGMSMPQVHNRYGKPLKIRQSVGQVKPQWPRITVWDYGPFAVYFERSTVLHTVIRYR